MKYVYWTLWVISVIPIFVCAVIMILTFFIISSIGSLFGVIARRGSEFMDDFDIPRWYPSSIFRKLYEAKRRNNK